MMSSAIPSAKNSCSGSLLIFWNGNTAIDGLSGRARVGRTFDRRGFGRALGGGEADPVDTNRAGDVLEALLAHVLEGEIEPAGSILLNTGRDADAAWVGQAFKAGSDIHAVAEDVIVLDHDIADVDPDPEFDAVVRGAGIAFGHAALPFGSTTQPIDDAPEFNEKSVAGRFDDAPVMLGDLRIDYLGADRPQPVEGSFLVRPHQPRIARDIGGQDRGEAAGRGHASGTPALRRPSRRRSAISPVGGMFSVIQVSENSGRRRSSVSRASAAAVRSPSIASAAVRKVSGGIPRTFLDHVARPGGIPNNARR